MWQSWTPETSSFNVSENRLQRFCPQLSWFTGEYSEKTAFKNVIPTAIASVFVSLFENYIQSLPSNVRKRHWTQVDYLNERRRHAKGDRNLRWKWSKSTVRSTCRRKHTQSSNVPKYIKVHTRQCEKQANLPGKVFKKSSYVKSGPT